ncbi:exosome complex component RRP4 [Cimex lectularius]|uniref:S1 motif domain-containing protein n=1 Tax=Cimex lectularius TaxID=79782 RepID=A0A8I6TH84_CIMLE|nr:exosome complex component RRP4 [Cimex lectularius]
MTSSNSNTHVNKKPHFRLASERLVLLPAENRKLELFTPGKIVTDDPKLMSGHGTYLENNKIKSSLAGIEKRVNKLIFIKPLKCRYNGEIGDVVIGRITEVQQSRWKVNINARLDGVLLLSSVNLPGGELRRRSVEDERMMRQYLSEGDLISAEVQKVYTGDALALHTRNLRYGKLSQGVLMSVPPGLIMRTKTHFHTICGASLIIGTNGFIWIYPVQTSEEGAGGFARNLDLRVDNESRRAIIRIQCCIQILADSKIMISDSSIISAVNCSSDYQINELLLPNVKLDIAVAVKHMSYFIN